MTPYFSFYVKRFEPIAHNVVVHGLVRKLRNKFNKYEQNEK
jgi:hypothetical protein